MSAGACGSRRALVSPNTIGCTLPKIAAKATPSATSRNGVAQGCSCIAVVSTMNSLVNTPKGGMPRMARLPITRPQPMAGLCSMSPRMSAMFCVPVFCEAWPTVKKIALLVSECTVMCNRPANAATGPPMPKAKVMMPMCSTDE